MLKSKLYARTDYESTIYSICMHQNLLFFMEKLPKWPFLGQKLSILASNRQLQSPPPILRVLDPK